MGLSRSGTLFLIGLLVLVALSVYPVASVDAVVRAAFTPARLLAELSRPFGWLSRSEVVAAEQEAERALDSDRERSHALLFASQAAALPEDRSLLVDRAALAAHVIGHTPGNRDELRLRFPIDAGVSVGAPIVCGDVFVGRISELDPRHPGECLAELVTARDFRVSARVAGEQGSARFVVGGVLGKSRREDRVVHLAVQFPDDRSVSAGLARVSEPPDAPLARLADGFVLGELTQVEASGTRLPGIRAPVDFAFGLNHLAILVPPERGTAGPVLPIDPFDPQAWVATRVLLAGDPSALRETRRVTLTTESKVTPGAAVSIGGRFVGRVSRVGALDGDLRLLGDPGLGFSALAKLPDRAAPVALGRLVSLGHSSGGAVSFECEADLRAVPAGESGLDVEIWTAASEPNLPPGLLVGTGRLVPGPAPFEIRVHPAGDAQHAQRLRVWRGLGEQAEGGT